MGLKIKLLLTFMS